MRFFARIFKHFKGDKSDILKIPSWQILGHFKGDNSDILRIPNWQILGHF